MQRPVLGAIGRNRELGDTFLKLVFQQGYLRNRPGFIIVGTTRETRQEKVRGAFLQTSGLLNNLALGKCSEEVRKEAGVHPYTPFESSSDNMTYASLVWNNVGSVKRAECRYVLDHRALPCRTSTIAP